MSRRDIITPIISIALALAVWAFTAFIFAATNSGGLTL